MKNDVCFLNTPIGTAEISGNGEGISSIFILEKSNEQHENDIPNSLKETVWQLQKYFEGELETFNVKINPKGTDFQRKVWHELQQVPFGKTLSYLELSKKIGNPKAVRAVAAANAKNPLWIIIPCHRIIGSDGCLTGYAGGLWRKQWLLEHENPNKQLSLI